MPKFVIKISWSDMLDSEADLVNCETSVSHLSPLQRYQEEVHKTNIRGSQDALAVAEYVNDKIKFPTQTTYTDLHEPLKLDVALKIHTSIRESVKDETSSC
jgi:DNA gyrase inhibitor GyrI